MHYCTSGSFNDPPYGNTTQMIFVNEERISSPVRANISGDALFVPSAIPVQPVTVSKGIKHTYFGIITNKINIWKQLKKIHNGWS